MTSDVTVSSFIICLDIVHNSFEPQAFFDYLKSSHKKNVFFINAPDFVDSGGRSSRNSTDSKSSGNHSRSSSRSISKGIKSKIASELAKLIEAKRKLIAQNEKKAQQLAKSGRPPSSPSHLKGNNLEGPPPFEGQTEVIFVIQGFPYTNSQLKTLSSYIDLGAFISIINRDSSNPNLTLNGSINLKKQADKPVKGPSGKKAQIRGCELDCAFNPGVVPPPRWKSLRDDANPAITFCQIDAPATIEECWNSLEHEIARIIRCKAEFDDHFKNHVFNILPSSSDEQKDYSLFETFLKQHDNDFINAMIAQIKDNQWKTAPPPPPLTKSNQYDQVFKQTNLSSLRFKVSKDPEPKMEPFFNKPIQTSCFDVLYKLSKWKLDDEKAAINKAVLTFYTNYTNFNAVAGHRYDSMLSQANKRLNLGLPLSFFEWTKYLYAYEHKDIRSTLIDICKQYYLFDSYLEESVGILWVLAMPPVSRTIGQAIRRMYMPPVIDGISEWLTRIFEKDRPKLEGRGRNQLTPHQLLKSGGDISLLYPDIIKRTEDPDNTIYKLPLEYGSNFDFASPYFFMNGIQVDIIRNIVNDKMTFGYLIHYPNGIEVSSYYNYVNIEFQHICKTIFEQNQSLTSTELHLDSDLDIQNTISNIKSLTIYPIANNQQSIYFNNNQLAIRNGNKTFLITDNGSLIFEHFGDKIALEPNGRIIKFTKEKTLFSEPDGSVYEITDEGPIKLELHHNPLKDIRTGITKIIREDKISYTVYADDDRIIQFDDHFIIRQTHDSVVYEIPNVPYITFRDSAFTFFIQDICFILSSSSISVMHVKGSTDLKFDYNEIQLNNLETEASLTQGIFQMRYHDTILYADETGTQRMGPLIPPDAPIKKKMEIVESKWGKINLMKDTHLEADHLKLLSIFRPRFFAIRSDLSATEYIHKEGFLSENKVEKSKTVDSLNIVTLHSKNESPQVYFKQDILEKQSRTALLKTLQIPKQSRAAKTRPKKGQEPEDPQKIIDEAQECNRQFLLFWNNISDLQNKACQELENEYIEEITPKPLPPPEIIRVPVFTPPPRVLEMMNRKNTPNVGSDDINYWQSPEAEFAYPLKNPPVLPRPLSPRTQLCDMPDQQRKIKIDKPPEIPDYEEELPTMTSMVNSSPKLLEAERIINLERNEISRMYQRSTRTKSELTRDVNKHKESTHNSPRKLSSRIYPTEVSRPQTAHSVVEKKMHRKVDFGTVPIGKTVTATLDIQNTGNKPLHYSVTQPTHKDVTMNTLPGKIMPGLKLIIKLTLVAKTVGYIRTSFQFMSQLGEMTIPVFANVISNEDLIEEEEVEN